MTKYKAQTETGEWIEGTILINKKRGTYFIIEADENNPARTYKKVVPETVVKVEE